MTPSGVELSTGLPGLDRVLKGLLPGDNVVWQVDRVEDYEPFIRPYCLAAAKAGRTLVYFRFARHRPLVEPGPGIEIRELRPEEGFETFIAEVREAIQQAGRGAYYVFDCLSDLAADWYSDQMLGNFFLLTCPYLYDMETVAYFSLLRNNHSLHATSAIADTTQILLNVYRYPLITAEDAAARPQAGLHLHPVKVQHRYSSTMHMLHTWSGDEFVPVTQSALISEVLTEVPSLQLDSVSFRLGVWNRTVIEAMEAADPVNVDRCSPAQAAETTGRLLRMVVSRDERILKLVGRYFDPAAVLDICKRMIGTGLIGGKAVGMLLSRAILRHSDPRWEHTLEPHDSFYIGSDVFYTFLVRNGIWWVREKQRDPETFLDGAGAARQRMLTGEFPAYIEKQFAQMLDYFGQSPFIVRSSSLLEDNFGNAFAGKYESVFCVNQGPRHQRLEDFISAVRTIYASAMSERALAYRAQRGLLDRDEQMALLVQRVSGAVYGSCFFPQVAGVGLSYNPYVWSEYIDPHAGVLRMVLGLGTRAVDRADDDYTRIVALNAPERRPEATFDELRRYSQRRADVLDLQANRLVSSDVSSLLASYPDLPTELLASRDEDHERRAQDHGLPVTAHWVPTFDRLFSETDYIRDMREMLHILGEAYDYPVEVEFTTNLLEDGTYRINLVQCRPLTVKGSGPIAEQPTDIPDGDVLMRSCGAVVGHSALLGLDRIVYVVPAEYGQLPLSDRHQVARLLGRVMHATGGDPAPTIALLGPGRWGTTTPSLGIPVTFDEISTASVLCEIVAMREDLIPDVSLGTHFFNEMIELGILYTALFPARPENHLNGPALMQAANRLTELVPGSSKWESVVRVIDAADICPGGRVQLSADVLRQSVLCYREAPTPAP
jgi:pyruvate, water dikinase